MYFSKDSNLDLHYLSLEPKSSVLPVTPEKHVTCSRTWSQTKILRARTSRDTVTLYDYMTKNKMPSLLSRLGICYIFYIHNTLPVHFTVDLLLALLLCKYVFHFYYIFFISICLKFLLTYQFLTLINHLLTCCPLSYRNELHFY